MSSHHPLRPYLGPHAVDAPPATTDHAGLPGTTARVRLLDEATAMIALTDPEAFRASAGGQATLAEGGVLWLELGPYAVARVIA